MRAAATGPVAPVPTNGGQSRRPVSPIGADTPLPEAATILAEQMRRIPGVERYADIALNELDQRGSRSVRAAWAMARDRMATDYGQLTVGELLSRFNRPG